MSKIEDMDAMYNYTLDEIKLKLKKCIVKAYANILTIPSMMALEKLSLFTVDSKEMAKNEGFVAYVSNKNLHISLEDFLEIRKSHKWFVKKTKYDDYVYDYLTSDFKINIVYKDGIITVIDYGHHIDELTGEL